MHRAVVKTPIVDLTAIPDPDLVSLPAIHTGDVGLGDPFRVTCESIESVHGPRSIPRASIISTKTPTPATCRS